MVQDISQAVVVAQTHKVDHQQEMLEQLKLVAEELKIRLVTLIQEVAEAEALSVVIVAQAVKVL